MLLQAYSILDLKTGAFNVPFFMSHEAMAVRACVDLAQDATTTVGRHPADFTLYWIGSFDDQTGYLDPMTKPQAVSTILALLPSPRAQAPLFPETPAEG